MVKFGITVKRRCRNCKRLYKVNPKKPHVCKVTIGQSRAGTADDQMAAMRKRWNINL